MSYENPAVCIAADLALAIHSGRIRAGEKLPSQSKLRESYGVAAATAQSALNKLSATGLTRSEPGRGTFAVDAYSARFFEHSPILDVLDASDICRHLAGLSFGPDSTVPPTVGVGGKPGWDDPHADPEKVMPPRQVEVSALVGLDRHILRWMSEAFIEAARRMVGSGIADADRHLIASARAILRDGGRRPDGQPGIALAGGPIPWAEDVVLRIWPERARPPGPGEPPF